MVICGIEAGQGICGAVVSSEIAKGETFHFLIHKEQASCCREFPNYRSFRGHMQNRHKRRLPMFTPYIFQYKYTGQGFFCQFFCIVQDNMVWDISVFICVLFLHG